MTETPNPYLIDADALTGEMHPIRRVVVSIGSNLGDRLANLQGAVDSWSDTPDVWVTDVSPVYETQPVDCPPDAEPYLNAVVLLDSTLAARRLMERALTIEEAFLRERTGVVNESRTLDVDLVVVGDRRSDEEFLRLPHPRAHERAFVLQPWLDLEPDAEIPGRGRVADLLERADRTGVERRDDLELTTP